MSDFEDKINNLNNTKDVTSSMDSQDIQNNIAMGILAYISWLVLIPIFAAKDSKFARFHANQGLVLAIVEFICFGILSWFTWIPVLGWIFIAIEGILGIVCLIYMVLGIVNAAGGKAKELPLIGGFKILK